MKLIIPLIIFVFFTQENKLKGEWMLIQESYNRDVYIKFDKNYFTVWKDFSTGKNGLEDNKKQIKDTTDYIITTLNNKKAFIATDKITKDLDTVFYNISNDTLYTKTYKIKQGIRVTNLESIFFRIK